MRDTNSNVDAASEGVRATNASERTGLWASRRTVLSGIGGLALAGGLGLGSASDPIAVPADDGWEPVCPPLSRWPLNDRGSGHAQTDTPPFSPRLKTYDGRQYTAYWTHGEDELVVAARDLPDGEWTQNHTGIEIDNRDGHWTPAVGIGPDGHVFVCYNTRNSPLLWRRSTNPADVTAFGDERVGMTGQNESSATYMEFTRLQDGTLLSGYREGSSGNGDWTLNRWTADSDGWEPLQHPLTLGRHAGEAVNSYHWNLIQSGDGVLHYFFNWRDNTGNGDAFDYDVDDPIIPNANLSYARSPDGGETWTRSDGTEYDLPITVETAEVVDPIRRGGHINQGWAAYDPRNDVPHVAYYRHDADDNLQIYHGYLDDGSWVTEAVTNRQTSAWGIQFWWAIARPAIVVDDNGGVHILTRDHEQGGWPVLVENHTGEWETSLLYRRNMTTSDIHIDPYRWREDRILSYIDSQQNTLDPPWAEGTLMAITDIDLDRLDRSGRAVDLSTTEHEGITSWIDATPPDPPLESRFTEFEDTTLQLPITDMTVPGQPAYARLRDVEVESDSDDATAEARLGVVDGRTEAFDEPVTSAEDDPVTTHWMEVPRDFGAANATLQLRTVPEDADDGVDPDDWADYAFETTLTVESEQAGVVFRAQGPDNFYMWQFADESHGFDQDLLRPHVRAGGSWTVLDEIPLSEYVDSVEGAELDIRIEADGEQITTWLDGQEVDSRTDDTHATGRIGFRQPPLGDLSRSILVDTITVTDVGGDVLFETDFAHDRAIYFEGGVIVDDKLRLENTGLSLLELQPDRADSTAIVTAGAVEVGYYDPTLAIDHPEDATEVPSHTELIAATGLREEAPVSTDSGDFVATPTSLTIPTDASDEPLYARLVADKAGAAARLRATDADGTDEVVEETRAGDGIRSTGWTAIPEDVAGGEVTLQIADGTVTSATLELAHRPRIGPDVCPAPDVDVAIELPDQLDPDEDPTATVALTNAGDVAAKADLDATVPDPLSVSPSTTPLEVGAGETETVELDLAIPWADAQGADHDLTVTYGPETATHTITTAWIDRILAGILIDVDAGHVRIAPRPAEGVDSAASTVSSPLGDVAAAWERVDSPGTARERDGLVLTVSIPDGATGTVAVPTLGGESVRLREDSKTIWNNGNRTRPLHEGIESVAREGDRVVVEVGSGDFDVELEQIGL